MGYLEYQNLFWLPEVASEIDVKGSILGKICDDCMKNCKQKKPSHERISQPKEFLEYLPFNLGNPYPST